MKRLFLGLTVSILSLNVFAQVFGGNPASVHWKQINTDTARIIFPEGMDSVAQRVAAIIHFLAKNNPAQLGPTVHKINIVLQTQTIIPNAYVGLAPFRSEFFLTPSTNNFDEGSINWADGLAVHEYRHVEQYNNFLNGLSQIGYYLLGEEGYAIFSNAAIPNWFYEGDAVYNETITTNQGRGRIPFFLNQYKSLWLNNKNYSWMKLRNGSCKNYVPDHYAVGYLLVNYGREKYGLDFWSKVTKDASAFKGLFYPFQKAVKKYSGVNYKTFRSNAFEYYKNLSGINSGAFAKNATSEDSILHITFPTSNYVTDYLFPYQLGGDSILYLKKTYRQRPGFVIRDSRGEHALKRKDISLDDQYSYRNGKIVYAAYETDARWGWRDYSVIKILDVQTGQKKTLAHHTKYFTPDISPNGKQIAVVEILPGGKNQIKILDASNAQSLQQIRSSEISLFTDPKFIDDNYLVTAVRLHDGRMALAIVDIAIGSIERLTVPSYAVIGYPSVNNGYVFFTGSYSGNDEIYVLRLKDRKVFQLMQTSLDNYFVNASGEKIVWSRFTADGYQLKQMEIEKAKWNEAGDLSMTEPVTIFPVSHAGKQHDVLLHDVPRRKFDETKYTQSKHLFYFHSWRPYFEDPDFSYSIYSDNILNTLSSEIFYHYNRDDKTNGIGANILYGGLYPFINAGVEYTFNQLITVNNNSTNIDKIESRFGLSLPLNFTRNTTFKNMNIGTTYVSEKQIFKGAYKDSAGNKNFSYLHHYLFWNQQVQKAIQHIYPRLGYSIALHHRYTINLYSSYQLAGNTSVYLPGFFSTHSIVFSGSYQKRDSTSVLFSDQFVKARGYSSYYHTRFGRTMWNVSANYHFPLVYPDWGFGNLVYFHRLRANIFFDNEKLFSRRPGENLNLQSTGLEFYFDTNWWNEYPITFGIRFSHLLKNGLFSNDVAGKNWFEFIIPVVIPK